MNVLFVIKKYMTGKRFWCQVLLALLIFAFSYGLAVLSEGAARQNPEAFEAFLDSEKAPLFFRNIGWLAALLIGLITLLTTKLSVGVGVVSIPFFILHVISAFKLGFRNEPLFPWDLSLAGEVSNIAASMDLKLTDAMIQGILYIIAALILSILADIFLLKKIRFSYKKSLIAALGVLGITLLSAWALLNPAYMEKKEVVILVYNQPAGYEQNGFVYSFVHNIHESKLEKPADYSQQTVEEIAVQYQDQSKESVEVEDPNVIIVMSEAFSDIWNAEKLHFEEELAPNFTSLASQYLSGQTMTSEFGGNTSNCEFEVLTGYSTYLLPSGTVPYMNYVNGQVDSYVSYLNSEGYYTVALHPYLRSFFSREKAYEVLGFDDFYSEEHFEGADRIRNQQYITDDAVVDRIIAEYEKNEATDQPFFCHTVTMQNHASFYLDDYPVEEQIDFTHDCELNEEAYNALRSYATGIHLADAALGKLVAYFEQVDEPTVILFFGDHQPAVYGDTRDLWVEVGYASDRVSPEGLVDLQSTPYVVWNNFEQEPTHQEETLSMFHMMPYITRTLNLPRPYFHTYMDSLYEQVKGVTRQVAVNGQELPVAALSAEEQEKFDEYLLLVYDGLIGQRYTNKLLYP